MPRDTPRFRAAKQACRKLVPGLCGGSSRSARSSPPAAAAPQGTRSRDRRSGGHDDGGAIRDGKRLALTRRACALSRCQELPGSGQQRHHTHRPGRRHPFAGVPGGSARVPCEHGRRAAESAAGRCTAGANAPLRVVHARARRPGFPGPSRRRRDYAAAEPAGSQPTLAPLPYRPDRVPEPTRLSRPQEAR
jgi:hypothetical protein